MRKVGTNKKAKLLPAALRRAKSGASSEFAEEYKRRLEDAVSRKDFTQQELNNMDNPYARRHSKILVYGSLKDFMVHERTGSFKRAIHVNTKGSNQYASKVNVEFIPTKDYHNYVFYGTKIMFGRNPILGVYLDMERLNRSYRIYMKHINKELKKVK